LGFSFQDFRPKFSCIGDWEAAIRLKFEADLVWVPCFRQRDAAAAWRWSRRRKTPLVFDPFISAYDKQVSERGKFAVDSRAARRLLAWERRRFAEADLVLADTEAHAAYFAEQFGVARERIGVVMIGAEEPAFHPCELTPKAAGEPLEILFFGSFIDLQGPETIVQAAQQYAGPPVRWTMVGAGPLLQRCQEQAKNIPTVKFEPWLPYERMPQRIHQADIVMGIFGVSPKAGRVIPNKVFQALACSRPVITRASDAYPAELRARESTGIGWVAPGNAAALAVAVARFASEREQLPRRARKAADTYREFFSGDILREQLRDALGRLASSMAQRAP
jgi:glycosyltransferase involved in cell wall biosynthesis